MRSLQFVAVAALLAAGPVHAACTYPKAPDRIPDGSTATREEMLAAQKAVKAYNEEMNTYLECLKSEYEDMLAREGANLTEERKQDLERMQVQRHNAAIDELQSVADRFNEQVRVFKARNDNKKK
ncbi:MAG: hypothetical protein DIU56_004360 [Pseudomonadota bacterium]|jgi:hypothetical protein|nr:MAG: hypothetical protein DIU56_13760 [Pseudomonadota bacterium]